MINYIEGLKSDLKKEAGYKKENDEEGVKEDDRASVERLFATKNKGKELYEKLVKYKADLLSSDERIKQEFGDHVVLTTRSFDSSPDEQKNFTKSFFSDIPLIAAMAMLSKLENNVKTMENDLVMYCSHHTNYGGDSYEIPYPIITQSSSCVKGGEIIEINAGIGGFSRAAVPRITINGENSISNENALVTYKFKTPLKPGKYFLPVKLTYMKPNGLSDTVNTSIQYTVAE